MTPSKKVDLNQIRVVAFDCDGVMFDTQKANRAYYDRMLAAFHMAPMTDDQFHYVQQHTVHRSIEHIFPDPVMREQAMKKRETLSYFSFIKDMEIEPGLVDLLQHLKPKFHTAIATNRSNTMNAVLETHGLSSYFEMVVTALDVAHAKPAPDQLHKVRDRFDVASREIFYIGDSELDAQAAASADVVFAAFRNRDLKADFHLDRMDQVHGLLNLAA